MADALDTWGAATTWVLIRVVEHQGFGARRGGEALAVTVNGDRLGAHDMGTDQVINGPDGPVLVPGELDQLRAGGFLLRTNDDVTMLDVLGRDDDVDHTVVARFVFTPEDFRRFVAGLVATQRDSQDSSPNRRA